MLNFIPTNSISPLLATYGYAIFLPLAIIEGPIVTVIAGSLVSLGYLNFLLIYVLAVLGDLIGDVLYYSLGRWGSERLLSRGRFLGMQLEHLERLEKHFEVYTGKTLFFGKWTQTPGAPILVAAGMAKVPLGKFIWLNFLATLPKALVFLIIGYYFGKAYKQIDTYLGYAMLSMLVAILLVAVVYLFARQFKSRMKIE